MPFNTMIHGEIDHWTKGQRRLKKPGVTASVLFYFFGRRKIEPAALPNRFRLAVPHPLEPARPLLMNPRAFSHLRLGK